MPAHARRRSPSVNAHSNHARVKACTVHMPAAGTADSLPLGGRGSNGQLQLPPHKKPRLRAANQATFDLIQSRHPTATAG